MIETKRFHALGVVFCCCIFSSLTWGQVNVTTYHNDNSRTGQNTQETILTPSNVNSNQFGRIFTDALDGVVAAEPLYLTNVSIAGGTHNVVYVATENDSLYAIDANTGAIYWQDSMIPSGGRVLSAATDLNGCTNIAPTYGISGTPVIDPTSGTIYLVTVGISGSGSAVQYLHAIDVGTSLEKFGGPILIQATVPGTAKDDGNGTTVSFDPLYAHQRGALLLENGHVIISWGSHCDISPWHGWVISYNAATLAQEGVFNTSPNGCWGGVWQGGSGPAVDASGNIYFATGNGDWNGTSDFGDSIMKLGPPKGGSFPVLDYFTPWNQSTMYANDLDVGSAGLVILPALSNGNVLLAQMGKLSTIYLLNTGNMGEYCVNNTPACSESDPQIAQEITGAMVGGVYGSPAYWNGTVYWGGQADHVKAYSFNANNSGLISTSPTSQSTFAISYPGLTPSISSNGASNGILWGMDNSQSGSTCEGGTNCQIVYAFNASNLATMLWASNQAPNNRDVPGGAISFATPMIANGHVYVGSQYAVSAYGPLVATPTFSPAPGNYAGTQSVTLSDATPGAVIHYTTNGTTPTASSPTYSGAISVSSSTTLQAIAVETGYANSSVAGGSYVFNSTGSVTNLASYYNVAGIATAGTAPIDGGLDTAGYAYNASLLGSTATYQGLTFAFGPANALDAVSEVTVPVAAGSYNQLYLLGTGVFGPVTGQSIVVTYTDGSSSTFTQSFSDWGYPQGYAGETKVVQTANRISPSGATQSQTWYLYGYSFNLTAGKTPASVKLPANRDVIFFGVGWGTSATPAPGFTLSPGSKTFTLASNQGGTDYVGITPANGFTGTVTFSASGFPAGVDSAFTSTSSTTGTTLVAWVPPGTAASTSTVTVTGTSGSLTASTAISFTVTAAPPSFTLSASTSKFTLAPNQGGTLGVSVAPVNGFSGSVSFTASGFPSGPSYTFLPASSTTGATLVIFAPTGTKAGNYTITVTGTSGSTTASTTFTLVIS